VSVLDLKVRVRCRGCGAKGRAVVSIEWERQSRWAGAARSPGGGATLQQAPFCSDFRRARPQHDPPQQPQRPDGATAQRAREQRRGFGDTPNAASVLGFGPRRKRPTSVWS